MGGIGMFIVGIGRYLWSCSTWRFGRIVTWLLYLPRLPIVTASILNTWGSMGAHRVLLCGVELICPLFRSRLIELGGGCCGGNGSCYFDFLSRVLVGWQQSYYIGKVENKAGGCCVSYTLTQCKSGVEEAFGFLTVEVVIAFYEHNVCTALSGSYHCQTRE